MIIFQQYNFSQMLAHGPMLGRHVIEGIYNPVSDIQIIGMGVD